jgi:hypothetical protein
MKYLGTNATWTTMRCDDRRDVGAKAFEGKQTHHSKAMDHMCSQREASRWQATTNVKDVN